MGIHSLTSIQFYKTYSKTELLHGIENPVLRIGEINKLKFFKLNLVKINRNHASPKCVLEPSRFRPKMYLFFCYYVIHAT